MSKTQYIPPSEPSHKEETRFWRQTRKFVTPFVVAATVLMGVAALAAPANAASAPALTTTTTGVGTSPLTPGSTTVSVTRQPVISGIGTAGDSITVSALDTSGNTTTFGTTKADTNGNWSLTAPSLQGGIYSVYATDTTANVTSLAATIDVETTIDASQSIVSVLDSAVPADGQSQIRVAVQVVGGNGGLIPYNTAGLQVTPAGLPSNVTASAVTWDQTAGTWDFTITGPSSAGGTMGSVGATVTIGGSTYQLSTVPFNFTGRTANRTTVSVDNAKPVASDGQATHTVSIKVSYDPSAMSGGFNVYLFAPSGSTVKDSTIRVTNPTGTVSTTVSSTVGGWVPVKVSLVADGSQSIGTIAAAFGGDVPVAPTPTKATSSVVSGTGTPGDTIKVTGATGTVGTTIVGSNGTWSVTPVSALAANDLLTVTQSSPQNAVSSPGTIAVAQSGPVDQAGLSVTIPAGTHTYGDAPMTVQVAGGSGTGTVTYTSSDPSIASVVSNADGTGTVTFSKAGNVTLTATKAADGNYNQATASAPVTVAMATPGIVVTGALSTTAAAQMNLTATVSKVGSGMVPQGSVTFTPSTGTAQTVNLDANGVATVPATVTSTNNVSYTVTYNGQTNYYNTATANPGYVLSAALPAPVVNPTDGSVVTGTATAGSTVTVWSPDGKSVLCQATANSSGQFSCVPSTTPNAGDTLLVTASNGTGTSPATPVTVQAKAQPTIPTAPAINAPTTGSKVSSTPTVSGTGTPGNTVTVYSDGSTPLGNATVDANGSWSVNVPSSAALPIGQHTLTAKQADQAGNASPASTPGVQVTVVDKPAKPTVSPTDGTTVSGTAEPGSTVKVKDPAGNVLCTATADASSGAFSCNPVPTPGDGTQLSVTATNPAGEGPAVAVTVNSGPKIPAPVISTPTAGTTVSQTPTISGSGVSGDTVTVYDGNVKLGTAVVDSNNLWSYPVPAGSELTAGAHSFTAKQSDGSNDSPASAAVPVTVKATDGTPTITSPKDGAMVSTKPSISGTGVAGDTVTVYADGTTQLGQAKVDQSGLWTLSTPSSALAAGSHTLTATQADTVGNVSKASPAVKVTVVTNRPTAPIVNPTDGTTVTGTAEPGSTVTVKDGKGNTVCTATADASTGAFSCNPVPTPANGDQLSVTATNPAGTSDPSVVTVNTGVKVPAPVIAAPTNGSKVSAKPVISGTGVAGDTVTVYADGSTKLGDATVGQNGQWTLTNPSVSLTAGLHVLSATQADAAKNVSPASADVSVTIVTAVPAAPSVNQPTDGSTVSGTAEPGSTVDVKNPNGDVLCTTTADASTGAYSCNPVPAPGNGDKLNVTATNPAGEGSATTVTVVQTPKLASPVIAAPTTGATVSQKPTISGTGVAGATVTVSDGNVKLGTAVVGNDNKWAYAVPDDSALNPGSHLFSATQSDGKNDSGVSNQVSTTVKAADAAPTIVTLKNGDAVSSTPTVSGTGVKGDTVTVYDGSTPIGTATVDDNGLWTLNVPAGAALPAGSHTLTAKQTDAVGNVSDASPQVTITVVTQKPTAPNLDPTDGTTVTGTAEPGSTVTVKDPDGDTLCTATADASTGKFACTPVPAPGNGTEISVTASNPAGEGPAATETVNSGSQPVIAVPVITSPSDGATVSATPTVTGTGNPGNGITVYYDGSNKLGTATVGQNGQWTLDVPDSAKLSAGSHRLTATQSDLTGASSAASKAVSVTVITTPPTAPVVNPTDGSTVSGTAQPGSTVTVKDPAGNVLCTATANASTGAFACTPIPTPGDGTTLQVSATNPAGTGPGTPVTVNSQTPLAAPVITSPVNNAVVSANPVISGTGVAGNTVTVYDGSTAIGTALVGSDNLWSLVPANALPGGSHTFTAKQSNAVGNGSPASNAVTVTVDLSVPAPPTVDPTNGTKVTGTGVPGNTIAVMDTTTGKPVGTAKVDGNGNWIATPNTPLPNGDVLSVTQANPAGAVSQPATITVDSVRPAPPVVDPTDGSTVSGTAEPGSTETVTDGNGKVLCTAQAAANTGAYSCVPQPTPGDGDKINVTATDPSGNTSGSTTVTVDKGLPSVPVITSPSNGAVVPATQTVSGTGAAGYTVTVYDGATRLGTATVAPNGQWSFTPPTALTVGSHSFTARQTNTAGKVSARSNAVAVTVAPVALPDRPNAPVVNPTQGATVTGTAQPGTTIKVTTPNGTQVGTGTVGPDGSFTVKLSPNQPAGTQLSVTATDPATGKTSPTTTVTVVSTIEMSRIQGPDRYSTAVAASQQQYPNGASTVILARGTNYPDAISAAPAAVKLNAPILLTQPTTLTGVTLQEINRLHPTKIIVLGDDVSVSAPVFNQLKSWMGSRGTVVRVAGPDRYATNRALISYVWGANASTLVAATGQNFTDAESAGAAASKLNVPLLLVNGNSAGLDAATTKTLHSMGTTTIHAVGDTDNLNAPVFDGLSAIAQADRTAGDDPASTSIAVAKKFFPKASQVYIATTDDFPDALVAGALAGKNGSPVLFTVNSLSAGIGEQILGAGATRVYVMGDNTRITDTAYNKLAAQLGITK